MDYLIELAADRLAARLRVRADISDSVTREHLRTVARSYVTDPDDADQLEAAAFAAVQDYPKMFQKDPDWKPPRESFNGTAAERETLLKAQHLI